MAPLNELKKTAPAQGLSANGAPAHEPEVWDEHVRDANPRFGHTPKSEPVQVLPSFNVADYLAEERSKDLLRFSTAGSVDDGKSTLIGRLLYDTQSVYDDQVRSIEGKGTTAPGVLDLALLTDGLRAEREGGITIDVAYRYFATARRKFIIADTPGHEQYTRNMATGASTADAAVVLVDARKGVLPQSRRHATITALLGVPQILVAINKMDLVAWSEHRFDEICAEFTAFFAGLSFGAAPALHFIPVSALLGDNIVHPSGAMPWYTGPTLLELLEELPSSSYADAQSPFRFPVQRVTRPNLDFRGFAGQIAAGTIHPGDEIQILPSGKRSRIARIVTFDGDLSQASAPLSVTLTLEDEIDISRGDLLVSPENLAQVATRFQASLVWMSATPLDPARRYLVKQTSRTVGGYIRNVRETLDLAAPGSSKSAASASPTLDLNGIALVELETLLPLSVDLYTANRHTGAFILIDPDTNATVAAGMIRAVATASPDLLENRATANDAPVTPAERAALWGHAGALLRIEGAAAFANAVERLLLAQGCFLLRSDLEELAQAGALVLSHHPTAGLPTLTIHTAQGKRREQALSSDPQHAAAEALHLLRALRVLIKDPQP